MVSLAEERIESILLRADKSGLEDVSDAIRISEKTNTSLPEEFALRVCDGCHYLLYPGKNSTVRISEGTVNYRCVNCGCLNRYGY